MYPTFGGHFNLTPRGFSIVRFVLQHLLGERPIEELDEGPKAERTDQGAKAHKATQQPAQQGAERIGEDAAPEVRAGCVVPQTEGKVIVGRDAEVGGLVERSAQRRDQHRRDDPRQLHRQRRRVAEVGVNGVIERRDDVPDADAVDEGAKADVLAPEPELQCKEQDVRAQVLHAQRDAQHLGQTHIQCADGVVAKVRLLEQCNAQPDDHNTDHHAEDAPRRGHLRVLFHDPVLLFCTSFTTFVENSAVKLRFDPCPVQPLADDDAHREAADIYAGVGCSADVLWVVTQRAVVDEDFALVRVKGEHAELPEPKSVVKTAVQVGAVLHDHADAGSIIDRRSRCASSHWLHQRSHRSRLHIIRDSAAAHHNLGNRELLPGNQLGNQLSAAVSNNKAIVAHNSSSSSSGSFVCVMFCAAGTGSTVSMNASPVSISGRVVVV